MFRIDNNNGFTLIEVLISIMILGLVMLTFLGMYTNGHKWVFDGGRKSVEIQGDQKYLENKGVFNSTFSSEVTIVFGNGTSVEVEGEFLDSINRENLPNSDSEKLISSDRKLNWTLRVFDPRY